MVITRIQAIKRVRRICTCRTSFQLVFSTSPAEAPSIYLRRRWRGAHRHVHVAANAGTDQCKQRTTSTLGNHDACGGARVSVGSPLRTCCAVRARARVRRLGVAGFLHPRARRQLCSVRGGRSARAPPVPPSVRACRSTVLALHRSITCS